MKKFINSLVILLLLAGCQSNKFISALQEEGDYPPPLTKDKYALTIYGFYVNKDETEINDGVINYNVIFDNRRVKNEIERRYTTVKDFEKIYPAYIQHVGKVNCGSEKNNVIVNRMDTDMNVITKQELYVSTLVSEKLCHYYEIIN